jgi:Spy/CpxP family protein refolding chaperone
MKKSWVVLLAAGVMSTLVALAADQPAPGGANPAGGGPGGGGPGGGGQGGGRAGGWQGGGQGGGQRGGGQGGWGNFQGRMGGMMGLDDQQRQLFQEALQKDSDKLRELQQKLQVAQKELVEAVLATNYVETTVRGKAEAVAKIQVEMTMLRAAALATVTPTLKPEQRQQMVDGPIGTMMLTTGGGGPVFRGGPGMGMGQGGGPGGFQGGPGGGQGGFPGGPGGGPGGAGGGPGGFPGGGPDQTPKER